MIADFSNDPQLPPKIIQSYNWNDGLFDLCWSESSENLVATAGGDGTVQLWNMQQLAVSENVALFGLAARGMINPTDSVSSVLN